MTPQLLTELLDKALTQEIGQLVMTNNHGHLQNILDQAKSRDPKYAGLIICMSSTPGEIQIVKKSVELDD